MKFTKKSLLLTSVVLAGLYGATGAQAQAPDQPSNAGDANAGGPDEIVVTATRRAEPLSKTAISVAALDKGMLDVQGIKDLSGIARSTPGLTFQTAGLFGGTNVSIRGIFSTIGAATTGVYIGETPVQVRNGIDAGLQPIYPSIFDLERVEVLRGPQGTLYGAGSQGGTIRYILAPASVDSSSTYNRAEIATTRGGSLTYEAGSAVGVPLIDGVLGVRASAWFRREGGWVDRIANTVNFNGQVLDEDANKRDLAAFRVAFLWKPIETLTIEPSVMYQSNILKDTNVYWEKDGRFKQEGMIPAPSSSRYTIASNTMTLETPMFNVTSVTSYLNGLGKSRLDETYFDGATIGTIFGVDDPVRGGSAIAFPGAPDFYAAYDTRTRLHQWSQEVRLSSNSSDDRFAWTVGGYFQDTRSFSTQREYEPGFDALFGSLAGLTTEDVFGTPLLPGGISYLQDVRVKEGQTAIFGDATVKIIDRLKLNVGLRYAHTRYSFERGQDGPWNGGPLFTQGSQREKPLTPKIGLTYDMPAGMIYATAAKGYRIGGANASLAGNPACANELLQTFGKAENPLEYKSDSLWSYEIGGKGRALNRRLSFAASAFMVRWNDIQGSVTLQCLFSFTANLGKAVSRGFDISVSHRVTDALTLGADVGYVDAHYTNNYLLGGQLLAKKDDRLPTPPWTVHVFADYTAPISGGEGYGRIDYSYNSQYALQPSADVVGVDTTLSPAQRLSQLSGRIGFRTGGVDLAIFADNILDDDALQYNSRWANSAYYLATGPRPRTIGITATFKK